MIYLCRYFEWLWSSSTVGKYISTMFITRLKIEPCIFKANLWKFRNTGKTLSVHSNVTCYEVGGWMFDPLSPASPTLLPLSPTLFLPPSLFSFHFQSTSFSSLPYTYTYIRASGEWEVKKLEVWVGWVWRVGGWGNREGLPLTVARRPPGWVGRAHNRVGPKKNIVISKWVADWLLGCLWLDDSDETFVLSAGLNRVLCSCWEKERIWRLAGCEYFRLNPHSLRLAPWQVSWLSLSEWVNGQY